MTQLRRNGNVFQNPGNLEVYRYVLNIVYVIWTNLVNYVLLSCNKVEWNLFIYYHRLFVLLSNDWNLLSTATPAINAWMNPCHRAILAANYLYSQLNTRFCTVMACIMTDALDVQGIHMPVKVSD